MVSNRPFDTTYGFITRAGLTVQALTPLNNIHDFYSTEQVFLGNIDISLLEKSIDDCVCVLMTITENAGGGQPVSMANLRQVSKLAREKGKFVWIDGCRIYENAFFIKAFEEGFRERSLVSIVIEMMELADVATVSFKKMFSHTGGAVMVNQKSFDTATLDQFHFSI